MRVVQPVGRRGSLKWMQRLASRPPSMFEDVLREAGALGPGARFTWLSPREDDEWAEYRDGAFLDRLGLSRMRADLAAFWPSRGPQWDGLGRGDDGTVYLIEAKAHAGELASTCQASAVSRARIEAALAAARAGVGAAASSDWLAGYYQYANRLAHLRWLSERGVPARLVFLYFLGDTDMGGPPDRNTWEAVCSEVGRHLGLPATPLEHVHSVYVDCAGLD